jgi:hypothetical protein
VGSVIVQSGGTSYRSVTDTSANPVSADVVGVYTIEIADKESRHSMARDPGWGISVIVGKCGLAGCEVRPVPRPHAGKNFSQPLNGFGIGIARRSGGRRAVGK